LSGNGTECKPLPVASAFFAANAPSSKLVCFFVGISRVSRRAILRYDCAASRRGGGREAEEEEEEEEEVVEVEEEEEKDAEEEVAEEEDDKEVEDEAAGEEEVGEVATAEEGTTSGDASSQSSVRTTTAL